LNVFTEKTEYGIINAFLQKIRIYDPDVIVGHDIYSLIFEILFKRIEDKDISL
jgi:DNA polymerase elongation subunit (family B)